jgi:hypothetical protein
MKTPHKCCCVRDWPQACSTCPVRTAYISFSIAAASTLWVILLLVTLNTVPGPARLPDPDFPPLGELQYGIRWFGKDNIRLPGYNVPPPNRNAPTFIFSHGWQPGATVARTMENFNYKDIDPKYGFDVNMADAWIAAGWNVGMFYWNQFADEAVVQDAEAKLWTPNGPQGMRWRTTDGSYSTVGAPNISIPELFVECYLQSFANVSDYPASVRLAGHSLGSQVILPYQPE